MSKASVGTPQSVHSTTRARAGLAEALLTEKRVVQALGSSTSSWKKGTSRVAAGWLAMRQLPVSTPAAAGLAAGSARSASEAVARTLMMLRRCVVNTSTSSRLPRLRYTSERERDPHSDRQNARRQQRGCGPSTPSTPAGVAADQARYSGAVSP